MASADAGGAGAILNRRWPSLSAKTPGAPARPKKKSGKSSLLISAAATLVNRPSMRRPTSAAVSRNVPSRRFLNNAGGPSFVTTSRSTSVVVVIGRHDRDAPRRAGDTGLPGDVGD